MSSKVVGSGQPEPVQAELSRDLGLISALGIGVGTMIAAGIFTLSGLAVGYVGSSAIISFLLAAGVAALTALTYCEFTSIYPESGEGYLYARKTFAPPLAYAVGWCLLLGYTSSCAFYISSLSSYFNEFIWHLPIEPLSGLVFLAALTLLNIKGTKESGAFQVVITIVKVLLLIWFVWGGMGALDWERVAANWSDDLPMVASTAALVFVTFFGFSAIAASAGDIQNPTRNVPLAIFLSMGIVTVLYSAVVIVMVTADLTEYTEAAMGVAARAFLGPIGGMVIVAGAIFSMISASNASILAGSRVALSMSRLNHLPLAIAQLSPETGTPIIALVLVGMGIGGFALLLPLENLAHFADCVLLVALTLVNIALIKHRRKYPDLKPAFRVPLVPLTPILGILANLYLLVQIPLQGHWPPVILAAIAMVGGFVGFLTWKGTRFDTEAPLEAPSRVLLERAATVPTRFSILLPIANPANANRLVDLAAGIARANEGQIISLRVASMKDQLPPEMEEAYVEQEEAILAKVRKRALKHKVIVSSQIRIGRNTGRAILETARERGCNLIVLGWKGHTSTTRRMLGAVTDHVVNHARCDILLVKLLEKKRPLRRILLPTAGGHHARRAEEYAANIAGFREASLTLLSIIPKKSSEDLTGREWERLQKTQERLKDQARVECKVIAHESIADCIVQEAEKHDAVIIGASGQSFTSQILFGGIPEEVAHRVDLPVIVVKHHEPVKALVGKVMTE